MNSLYLNEYGGIFNVVPSPINQGNKLKELLKKDTEFTNRSGSHFLVGIVTDKNFQVIKSSGKFEKVSFKKVAEIVEGLKNGLSYNFQANSLKGGISYTIAIESGVIYLAGLVLNTEIIINTETRKYSI